MSKALHLRWEGEDYRSLLERELSIHGIPTAVVDPHHHVLPFWAHHLEGRQPVHLLHVDAHHDLWVADTSKQALQKSPERIVEYTRKNLTIADFIWAADYLDLLHSIIWFDPRKKQLVKFKDKSGASYIRAMAGSRGHGWSYGDPNQLFFNLPSYQRSWHTSRKAVQERINADDRHIVLDIDLDAFECSLEPYGEKNLPRRTYQLRLEATFAFLACIRKPSLITIARSQYPRPFVPTDRVFDIEADVLGKLEEIYSEGTITAPHSSALPVYPCERTGQLSLPL